MSVISKELKNRCTGCGACKASCPVDCITMTEENDGFVYPFVDKCKCIECGKCERVCPIEKDHKFGYKSKAYGAVINNEKKLLKSTSGGAFSAIADHVFKLNGVVYGCSYDKSLKPVHIRIVSPEQLRYLNGSKYVQSDTKNTFRQVQSDLKQGRIVLYSGTPCQISGLKSFLGKDHDNLITVDIICHGVPSFAYFQKYLKWLERSKGINIKSFQFRSKERGGWNLSGSYSGTYVGTGKPFKKRLNYFDSYYYHYFLNGDIYRESCYRCEYANMDRQGDFTLGDLWGAEGMGLDFNTDNGCSLLLANSLKAKEILPELDLSVRNISIEKAIAHNEQLKRPSKKSDKRSMLIKQFENWNADEIDRFFRSHNLGRRLYSRIKYLTPASVKKILQSIRYNR